MHQSVYDKYHDFSRPLEGRVHWMYPDILGLITTGVGNLIDPISAALPLPWKHKNGTPATQAEVTTAWNTLKNHPGIVVNGSLRQLKTLSYKYAEAVTGLYLSDADIDLLVRQRMDANEVYLRKVIPRWDNLPADAQLAIMSLSWAVGAGFMKKFPTLSGHILSDNWGSWDPTTKTGTGAAGNCTIREAGNPGVIPRNVKNRLCFANAGIVSKFNMDPTVLHWPEILADTPPAPVATKYDYIKGNPDQLFQLAEEAVDMAREDRNRDLAED